MDKCSHFLFFADDLSSDTVVLDSYESRHAASVLRVPAGASLRVTDGKGTLATGICEPATRSTLTLHIDHRTRQPRRTPQISLCIGLPDRNAFEEIVTNTTALGVSRIVPVAAHFCQKKWWSSDWEKLQVRFRQKMIAALKQSQNTYLPEIISPQTMAAAAELVNSSTILVADPTGQPLCNLQVPLPGHKQIAGFVGPPGGFSEDELRHLEERLAIPVAIAPARLRSELAATALCAQIVGFML
jgi:16S rRNA (uracil1498-N3)-methyltransferase